MYSINSENVVYCLHKFLVFSRFFRRNTTTTKTNQETSTPVEPQVQDKNKATTEIQSTESKKKVPDNADFPRDNVRVKSELESQESVYYWSLPSELASYAKEYMRQIIQEWTK